MIIMMIAMINYYDSDYVYCYDCPFAAASTLG